MSAISQDLKRVKVNMVHQGKNVYSGTVEDLPEFNADDQTVDHVKLFNAEGSFIMSMNYRDFKKIIEDVLL